MNTTIQPPNILVVDDTRDNLRLLANILTEQGYQVRPVPQGSRAITAAQSKPPDLILLDIMMPGMDGYAVCEALKADERTRDIPVIFISALNETFDKVKAFSLGGVDYITKPFQSEEVLARVKTHITIRHLQQELEDRNRELARLVNIDGLTQIANRRYFDTYLEHEWRRSVREQQPLSLIFLDIDYFKLYNDHYGHQAGDECLKQVAQIFDHVARRPADLAARYGGEEFVILLPNTDEHGAQHLAEEIQEHLQQLAIPHEPSSVSSSVTCSMGIACTIPNQAISAETFVSTADEAVYQAKARGRNRIVVNAFTQLNTA
jgi:diguanylate cyclase (GGDEF)-like protein